MPIINKEDAGILRDALSTPGTLNEQETAIARSKLDAFVWAADNIDTTPVEAPVPRSAGGFLGRPASGDFTQTSAPDPASFAPESPEGQRRDAAAQGLRQNEGLPFGMRFDMAMAFDDEETQMQILQSGLHKLGIPDPSEVPAGVNIIEDNDTLGVKTVLVKPPGAEKFHRITLDEFGLGLGDFADAAEPEEIAGMIGGILGAVAGRAVGQPFKGEFFGEVSGRTVGTAISALYQKFGTDAPVSLDEFRSRMLMNWPKSAIVTMASRATEKSVSAMRRAMVGRGSNKAIDKNFSQTPEEVKAAMAEAAGDVEEIGGITLTQGEASGDVGRLAEETSRASVATARVKNLNEVRQRSNIKSLLNYLTGKSQGRTPYNAELASDTYRDVALRTNAGIASNVEKLGTVQITDDVFRVTGEPVRNIRVQGAGAGAELNTVVRTLDDGTPVQQIEKAFVSDEFRGSGESLYLAGIQDAATNNRTFVSGSAVSKDALGVWRKLEAQGHTLNIAGQSNIPLSELVRKDGSLTEKGSLLIQRNRDGSSFIDANNPTDPLLRVEASPAKTFDNYLDDIGDKYERASFEAGLEEVEEQLLSSQAARDSANLEIDTMLGWNPERQSSRYQVQNNLSRNNLGRKMAQLRNTSERAIGRGDAREADRLLDDLFRSEDLVNVGAPRLDVRQLAFTRDRLLSIAEKGNALAGEVAGSMSSLLRNGKWFDRTNNVADVSDVAAKWFKLDMRAGQLTRAADRNGAELTANLLLQRGRDGQFKNTSISALSKMTRDGASGADSLRIAVNENPMLKGDLQSGMLEIWKREAFKADGSFSVSGHQKFVNGRADAIDLAFDARTRTMLDRAPQRLRQEVSKSQDRLKVIRKHIVDAEKSNPDFDPLNPKAFSYTGIWRSLRKMGPAQRRLVMNTLREEGGEEAVEQINNTAIREVGEQAKRFVESGDYSKMQSWIDLQEGPLKEQFGAGYVESLRTVNRTLKRMVDGVTQVAPDSQPLWLRISRSALGPLSKKQRMITAANFGTHRVLANNVLKTISDPAKLRSFRIYNGKNGKVTANVVAGLTRLGVLDGIPLSDDPSAAVQQVQALFDSVDAENAELGFEGYDEERTAEPEFRPVLPGQGTVEDRRNQAITNSTIDIGA